MTEQELQECEGGEAVWQPVFAVDPVHGTARAEVVEFVVLPLLGEGPKYLGVAYEWMGETRYHALGMVDLSEYTVDRSQARLTLYGRVSALHDSLTEMIDVLYPR